MRPFRDRVFSTGIKRAYDNTCAISGLRIINGGRGAEAQAAHIRPVHADGPDSLRNGVALSATIHWMFDCGLVSIDDDYSLLFKRNAVPGNVLSPVNRDGRLRVPEQEIYRPHRRFLEWSIIASMCSIQGVMELQPHLVIQGSWTGRLPSLYRSTLPVRLACQLAPLRLG